MPDIYVKLANPPLAPGFYLRLGAGSDWPKANGFSDNNCSNLQPPALFGCGTGNNGQALGASGSFEPAAVIDTAAGYRFNSWLRAEALLSWRPELEFSGQSNFLGLAGANQPVTGSASSVAGFGVAYVDLPKVGRVRPFLGAGLGVARNSLSSVSYRFPGIAANAATVTPDGSSSGLAYLLTAGISIPLNKRLDLDLAYRFSDLGKVRTSSGQAGLSRPTLPAGTDIPIGGTQAALQAHGVQLSLRYSF